MRPPPLLIPRCIALLAILCLAGCVQQLAPAYGCSSDADCGPGELCSEGSCAPGQAATCSVEDEGERCGVGSYCDAAGQCAELPSCAGGAACPAGLVCNDATGQCVREPTCEDCCTPGSCDDGRFCNGVEVCSPSSGRCVSGDPPCSGAAPVCEEASRSCLCSGDEDCTAPEVCDDGTCRCTPDCDGKQCGGDGCGGSCGSCALEDECNEAGLCTCVPDCDGKECGSDGCDGSCGGCEANETCLAGSCACVPDCNGKQCGGDGCGGSCGSCDVGACSPSGVCNCVPDCTNRVCGDDGCGGSCGDCAVGVCGATGSCDCTPSCAGKVCGADGCGGSCGTCGPHQACLASGQCQNTGVLCDVLTDTITLDEYQSRSGFLTAGFDEEYVWDNRPARYLDNYPLTAPAGSSIVIDLTSSAFDPTLYVYNVAGGTCTQVAKDDDSGPGLNASLALTVGNGSYHVVATTFGELATGAYTIATTAELCGLTISQSAYDKCQPRVAANGANGCNSNWCVDYGNSPEFCCIKDACRSGFGTGDEIRIFNDPVVCTP